MTFSTIDWLVLIVYLILTAAAGLYAKRYVENLSGYMVAGRRVGLSLGVATFAATELGVITFMYFAELGYVTGFSCFIIGLLAMFAYMLVGTTGFIIERLRQVEVMTIPEYYQLRYSRSVRLLGGIILFLGGVLNMGIFLKFDGIFLSEVMGFGPSALAAIMVVMIVVVVLYTVLGGMFSVVVTDYMQFVVLSIGVFVAVVAVMVNVDLGSIVEAVNVNYGASGVSPLVNPRFGWMFIVWIFISNVAAGALLTAMVLVQLAVNDVEAGLSPAVNEAFEHVEFGLDLSWDVFLVAGTILFSSAMLADPRFGRRFACGTSRGARWRHVS